MSDNSLSKIVHDVEYSSGPLARTELHAGGIFFCVLYEDVLIFRPNNVVEHDVRILDDWRPLDDEADSLVMRTTNATYGLDSKGNVSFKFPHARYTGLACDINPNWLAFNLFYIRTQWSDSRVYTLRDQ